MSLNELQLRRWDGAFLVELAEEKLLDMPGWVRNTLLLVAITVGLGVEDLSVYPVESCMKLVFDR